MAGEIGPRGENPLLLDAQIARDRVVSSIPVDAFISHYQVNNEKVREVLYELPSLCYLLGNVTDEPQANDIRPDGIERPVFFLTKGSAMFGLKNPDDAERWKGIGGNHVPGTARQTQILAEFLCSLSDNKLQIFADLGYDIESFRTLNPYSMRDFMLVSHAGRREADELKWHPELSQHSLAHHTHDSYENTKQHLEDSGAPQEYLDLMRVENHTYLTTQVEQYGIFPNAEDLVCTVPDWMFGQSLNTLQTRFKGLRESGRTSQAVLDELEIAGMSFAKDFERATGVNLYSLFKNSKPLQWEKAMREAYCAPSGIEPETAFPLYYEQFPQLRNTS